MFWCHRYLHFWLQKKICSFGISISLLLYGTTVAWWYDYINHYIDPSVVCIIVTNHLFDFYNSSWLELEDCEQKRLKHGALGNSTCHFCMFQSMRYKMKLNVLVDHPGGFQILHYSFKGFIADGIKVYHVNLTGFKETIQNQYMIYRWSEFCEWRRRQIHGGDVQSRRIAEEGLPYIYQFMHLEICISYLRSAYQLSFSTPVFTSMAFLHGARFLPEITFTLVGVIALEKWELSTRSTCRCRRESRVKNSLVIRVIYIFLFVFTCSLSQRKTLEIIRDD